MQHRLGYVTRNAQHASQRNREHVAQCDGTIDGLREKRKLLLIRNRYSQLDLRLMWRAFMLAD